LRENIEKVVAILGELTKRFTVMVLVFFMSLLLINSAFAADDSWIRKEDMPEAKHFFGSAELNGKIYAIGGADSLSNKSKSVYAYDVSTNTWETKPDLSEVWSGMSAVTANGKIYIVGGFGASGYKSKIYEYNETTSQTTSKTDLWTSLTDMGTVFLNGKIYVIGGAGPGGAPQSTVKAYDLNTNTWETKANLLEARSYLKAVAVNGKIYAIGGSKGSATTDDSTAIDEYDPVTDTWTNKANLPRKTSRHGAAVLNNKIYIVGGGSPQYNNVEEYDPSTNTLTSKAPISAPKYTLGVVQAAGKLFAMGGQPNAVSKYLEEYVPGAEVKINLTATGGNAKVDLSWSAVTDATGYNVKRSTTPGGPYTTIATGVTGTTYTDTTVTNGTTYYYVVTAVNAGVESANSNEASATPNAPTTAGRAILTITLMNGIEKEYDLSMAEVNAFTAWYDAKADGTGPARYTLDDQHAKGPFKARKDNIIFNKIITFDIDEYTPEN